MKFKKALKITSLIAVLIMGIVGSFIGIKLLFLYRETQSIPIHDITLYETTKIYDHDGGLISTLGIEKRELITYDEIAPIMIDAITSIEDARFFNHKGIDTKRIISAFTENLKTGSYKEGASTITQQLVKLQFLTSDKTIERKVKEAFLSLRLEKVYDKEEILEMYLNKVLFGGRIYGIENASNYYFDKDASELNYQEAALLAGIIQSPNRYNPYTNEEVTKRRQIQVLTQMRRHEKITEDEYQIAINTPLSELVIEQTVNDENQPFYYEYLDYVIQEIMDRYGLDPFKESLTIHTYLDTKIQDHVTEIERDQSLYKDDEVQTGMIVIENGTGAIRAIGGGRNYHSSMLFNYATDAKIQPGSTIKPILDYGPAIEYLNYAPGTQMVDEKIYYSTMGSRFMPVQNYDRRYRGTLTVREALVDSRNVTAIKAFREVGSDRAYRFAEQLGLEFNDLKTEANALGAFEHGYNVLTMAGAYSAFATNGYYTAPTTIEKITHNGKDITIKNETKKVMKEETAYLMNDMLHSNMINGTANRANVPGHYIAGKTGQTNFDQHTRKRYSIPSNAVRDSWFIGYSNLYTTAVWVGYDRMAEDNYLTPAEARLSLELFKSVMTQAHEDKETKAYERPESIVEVEIELGTAPSQLPNIYTPQAFRRKELFIKGYEPTEFSETFQPLEAPELFVYFDENNEHVILNWQRSIFDYDTTEYNVMHQIHTINKFYDDLKDTLQYEYYHDQNHYPSYRSNDAMLKKINDYCLVNGNSEFCLTNQLSFTQHTQFLDQLNAFERNKVLTKQNNLQLLSEAEVSDIKWMQSKLGKLQYTITFHDGLRERIVYQGPYRSQVELDMGKEEFISYSAFSIKVDFSNYRYRLESKNQTSLNPYFAYF